MNETLPNREEFKKIITSKPHVVILGAGASRAAFPNGDKNGKKLPLMNDFIDTLELEDLIKKTTISNDIVNFEEIYDELHKKSEYNDLRHEIENKIYKYFRSLEITDETTIYDHLLLSLKEKDCIATFNWDPLLVQAARRNYNKFPLPYLIYLHGNVAIGYCMRDKVIGLNGGRCSKCYIPYKPTKLLYPIREKNYDKDGFITHQWEALTYYIKNAFMITFFGYSAPETDTRAIDLMKLAWGEIEKRNMEQIEIIDIKSEDSLKKTWKPFIHTHHYDPYDDFYSSWIANHPRRTEIAYFEQYYEAKFIDSNPIPKDLPLDELWEWLNPLREAKNTFRE